MLLNKGAEVDQFDKYGWTALVWAACKLLNTFNSLSEF